METRNERDHAVILERLNDDSDHHLSRLIMRMMAWDPKYRPSAQEALTDPCLRATKLLQEPEVLRTGNKRSADGLECEPKAD